MTGQKRITHFFNQDVVIRRYRTIYGNKKAFQSTATVEGMIQNKVKIKTSIDGIISERQWVGYFDIEENVLVGDQVVNSRGVKFIVREVTRKDYGVNTHLECILEESNE